MVRERMILGQGASYFLVVGISKPGLSDFGGFHGEAEVPLEQLQQVSETSLLGFLLGFFFPPCACFHSLHRVRLSNSGSGVGERTVARS
jgi:hypothetical protein